MKRLFLPVALFVAALLGSAQTKSLAPDYEAHAREVVSEIAARQFDKVVSQGTPQVAAALPADKLAKIWDRVLAQFGNFQRIQSAVVREVSGYHVVLMNCAFTKANWNIQVAFDSENHIAGLSFPSPEHASAVAWTPPAYADQSRFHEQQITVTDGKWRLPGWLTLPNGKGPFPGLVFVAGSGPEDADETIGPNKVAKDLAWGLASNGVAVLRYTKRTKQYGTESSSDPKDFTVKQEYLEDARAALVLLASQPEVNAERVDLVGHSEGGYLAPRMAAGNPFIHGIAILAGNTRPLEKMVLEQLRYQQSLGGPDAAQIEKMVPEAEKAEQEIESPDLKPGTTILFLGQPMPSSYFLDLRNYHPLAVAAKLKIPILIMQGGRDAQVTSVDFANWEKALAGHRNVTLKFYPSLNHLFISGTGPSTPAEYAREGHVSQRVIADLSAWIKSRR